MSTIIATKFGDTVVLATDSRTVDSTGKRVASDTQQKIFEIADGLYFAWSGYADVAVPQAEIATAMASFTDLTDLRTFANRLDAASAPLMVQMLAALAEIRSVKPEYEAELSGKKPFCAYVLGGVSDGCPGYLSRQFWFVGGQIAMNESYNFKLPAGHDFAAYIVRGELLTGVGDPKTWKNGPIAAVEGFVDRLRQVHPEVGGPIQMVCIDGDGPRWIHRPPSATQDARATAFSEGTLTAGVVYGGSIVTSQIAVGGSIVVNSTAFSAGLTVEHASGAKGIVYAGGVRGVAPSGSGAAYLDALGANGGAASFINSAGHQAAFIGADGAGGGVVGLADSSGSTQIALDGNTGNIQFYGNLDFEVTTASTAGAIVAYVPVTVNGVARKLAIYAV